MPWEPVNTARFNRIVRRAFPRRAGWASFKTKFKLEAAGQKRWARPAQGGLSNAKRIDINIVQGVALGWATV